ncbi:transcriptional regulator [Bacillus sp. OxB-1]|uniref:MarR family winged helix-turn-helix transcriptional regulator n=1 Tax=Bacillus sp. (strain OxB-1) TaxID=98228 RepID=UPI000581E47A|nr:MarR family transcriptional regulator [Bacillus sp. OxB-1]BAQ08860.1 transcriptional regulator [Bacillus sp. OxB-1]
MKPHKQLFYEYAMLHRPYMNELNAQLAPFHLSLPLWLMMRVLYHEGEHTISGLSKKRNVEKPTTTKMVQRLEELQLVDARSGSDRRTKNLYLTEHGLEVSRQVEGKISRYQESLLEGVSEEERLLVAQVLQNISKKIASGKGRVYAAE